MYATRQLKDKIFLRDRYMCAYCLDFYQPEVLRVDHIFPKSKGGKDDPKNFVTACRWCNAEKYAKVLEKPPIVENIKLEEGDLSISTRQTYPSRKITVSPEVWKKLKTAKLKTQKTWTNYFKDLINQKHSI
jgi:hypothetical protein